MRKLSTIMLARNQTDLTLRAVRALLAAGTEGDLVLVDQASSEGTAAAVEKLVNGRMQLRVVRNETNEPYAVAANLGAADARGDALLFLDNDTELEPEALGLMLATLAAEDQVVAVGPKLVYPTGHIQEAGLALPLWLVPLPLGANARDDDHRYSCPRQAFALSTSCLLVRREAFEAVGGFDEAYVWGFEAADLALSLRRAGGRVFYEPRARCVHDGGATLRTLPELQRTGDNRKRFLKRWGVELFRRVAHYLDRLAGDGPRSFFIFGSGECGRHLANTLEVGGYEVAGFLTGNGVQQVGQYPAWSVHDRPKDRPGRILIGSPYVREAEDILAHAGLLAGAALPVLME